MNLVAIYLCNSAGLVRSWPAVLLQPRLCSVLCERRESWPHLMSSDGLSLFFISPYITPF